MIGAHRTGEAQPIRQHRVELQVAAGLGDGDRLGSRRRDTYRRSSARTAGLPTERGLDAGDLVADCSSESMQRAVVDERDHVAERIEVVRVRGRAAHRGDRAGEAVELVALACVASRARDLARRRAGSKRRGLILDLPSRGGDCGRRS